MAATIEIWEDTGGVVSLHGATRAQVTNNNWKNSGAYNAAYYIQPLRRPDDDTGWTCSYTKYLYFKIYGTFTQIKNLQISISAVPAMNTQLYGKLTNTYAEPTSALAGDLTFMGSADIPAPALQFFPLVSTTGPESATTFPIALTSGTYYTQYFKTQLRVINSTMDDVGNTAAMQITFSFNEYE